MAASEGGPDNGVARHLKRYGVFYAIAIVVLIVAVVLPNTGGDDGNGDEEVAASSDDGGGGDDDEGAWVPASGKVDGATGKTRSGAACKDGVRQMEGNAYSPPCLAVFDGDNGGETARGVTSDTIKIVLRSFPESANSQQVQRELEAAGFATAEVSEQIRNQFIEHFNKTYELYGRKVEVVEYESKFGNATQEALGGGREGACQDATLIADEMKAFGVFSGGSAFTECAAERGLVVFSGGAYFSEDFYRKWSPYVYNDTMSCDRINVHVANYIANRLAKKPAKWAGDAALQSATRKFGTYVPDNEEYQKCTKITGQLLKDKGLEQGLVVSYSLDISRFVEQADRAIVQFKADGVTTIVTASDPISIGLLTKSATKQNYFPEWFIIGTAGQDTDNFGRSYDQKQVSGHMFGISQLGTSSKIYGPDSEAGKLYQELNGKAIPPGTTGSFYTLTHIWNLLQAAGPTLTAENIEKGIATMPPAGAPDYPVGRWFYGEGTDGKPDHTAVDDSREVYWKGDAPPGPEQPDKTKLGSFIESDPGKRYDTDEWPTGEPKVYPGA